jgi:glucuronate isomerase
MEFLRNLLPVTKVIGKNSKNGRRQFLNFTQSSYHWTHLELQRYFDVNDILNPDTAKKIYDETSAKLQEKNSV